MNITYRKLTENDLDTFIKMRIDQLREEGAKDEIDLELALRVTIGLSAQAECLSWKSRRISVAQAVKSDCCQVCSQIKPIEGKVSQRHCFQR